MVPWDPLPHNVMYQHPGGQQAGSALRGRQISSAYTIRATSISLLPGASGLTDWLTDLPCKESHRLSQCDWKENKIQIGILRQEKLPNSSNSNNNNPSNVGHLRRRTQRHGKLSSHRLPSAITKTQYNITPYKYKIRVIIVTAQLRISKFTYPVWAIGICLNIKIYQIKN
jgi:hypothetical protein